MASEYKLIPFNTYRECLAVTFKNVLSNNRWSIERALELYNASDQTYKDYLRCKYTLLLLGPRSNEKIKKITEKQISNDKCESNNSDYFNDAKQRFVSLLTGDGTEPKRDEVKKGKSFQEDKNKVDSKMSKSKQTKKRMENDKFSNSVLKHLQAYVTDSVAEKEDREDREIRDSKREIKSKYSQENLSKHELKADLKEEGKQKILEEQKIDPLKRNATEIVPERTKYKSKDQLELQQDIKVSNKNGTAIISESGNSTIHLDSI